MEKHLKGFLSVFLIVLFFISSCGIPSFLSCDGSLSSTDTAYTVKLDNFHINASGIDFGSLKSQISSVSPSLTFFYTISNSSSKNSSIVSSFNNEFSSEIGYKPKSNTITSQYSPVVTYKANSKNLNLYVMGGSPWSSDLGHINRSTETGDDASFTFSLNSLTDPDLQQSNIEVKYNGEDKTLSLKRFNGEPFMKNSVGDDYSYLNPDETIYINVYVALNVIGSSQAEFTNRLWSDLYYINSFEI